VKRLKYPNSSFEIREIVAWEEDVDFWDGLLLSWAVNDDFGEEALPIRDAMVEYFLFDKMIVRQKSKGKRELLNLQSSINYADVTYQKKKKMLTLKPPLGVGKARLT